MSIRSLLDSGLVRGTSKEPLTPASDLSIAFALDSGYLMPLKVMLASMARARTLLDCPIVVYSDDEKLFADPIVQLVVDKKVLLEGERRDRLYTLARDSVGRQDKRGDWNRGTFLKWAIFEPQATSRLLFLDVDMVVIGKLEEIVHQAPGAKLAAAPQFQTDLTKAKPEIVYEALHPMIHGTGYPGRHSWRINSGVMLVKDEFLSDEFFDEISSFALKQVRVHEQEHLSEYFRHHPGHQMIPAAYNCQEHWVRKLSTWRRAELLRTIKILHYAGRGKPWKKPPYTQAWDPRQHWYRAAKGARAFVAVPNVSLVKHLKFTRQLKSQAAKKTGPQKEGSNRKPKTWGDRFSTVARRLAKRISGR